MTIFSNTHYYNRRWLYSIVNVNVRMRTITLRSYIATSRFTPNRNKLARTLIYSLDNIDLAYRFSRRYYHRLEDFFRDISIDSDLIIIFDDIKTSYYDN